VEGGGLRADVRFRGWWSRVLLLLLHSKPSKALHSKPQILNPKPPSTHQQTLEAPCGDSSPSRPPTALTSRRIHGAVGLALAAASPHATFATPCAVNSPQRASDASQNPASQSPGGRFFSAPSAHATVDSPHALNSPQQPSVAP